MTRRWRTGVTVALAVALVLGVAACGGSSSGGDGARKRLTIERAWARATPAGATNGAVYLTITSPRDDAITSVEVPAAVAGGAAMHSSMTGDDGGSMGYMAGMDHDAEEGTTTMTPLRTVDLPAGEAVVFEPGGRHIMLTDLAAPLDDGGELTLTVHLRRGGDRTVRVPIATNAPD